MSKAEKHELAWRIIKLLQPFVVEHDKPAACKDFGGTREAELELGDKHLDILRTTPLACIKHLPAEQGLDIWLTKRKDGRKKVFSAWWSRIDLVCFDRGPWIDELIDALSA